MRICEVRSFVFKACVKKRREREGEKKKKERYSHTATSLSSNCLSFSNETVETSASSKKVVSR